MISKIASKLSLSKNERLKSRKLIGQLFRDGKALNVFPFRIIYMLAPSDSNVRAGFSASTRNFKKAVHRNRIKRLLREAYRLHKPELSDALVKKGKQLSLFIIYTGKEQPDYNLVKEKIKIGVEGLIKKINEPGS